MNTLGLLAQIPPEVAKAGIEQVQKVQPTDNTLPLLVGILIAGFAGMGVLVWKLAGQRGGARAAGAEGAATGVDEEIDDLKDRVTRLEERHIYHGKELDRLYHELKTKP